MTIKTKPATEEYRANFDAIFKKKCPCGETKCSFACKENICSNCQCKEGCNVEAGNDKQEGI